MKFHVFGSITVGIDMKVEADSEEQAIEKAHELWPGMSNYCGNGKNGGALVGPHQEDSSDANIDCDGEAEFTVAEKL